MGVRPHTPDGSLFDKCSLLPTWTECTRTHTHQFRDLDGGEVGGRAHRPQRTQQATHADESDARARTASSDTQTRDTQTRHRATVEDGATHPRAYTHIGGGARSSLMPSQRGIALTHARCTSAALDRGRGPPQRARPRPYCRFSPPPRPCTRPSLSPRIPRDSPQRCS